MDTISSAISYINPFQGGQEGGGNYPMEGYNDYGDYYGSSSSSGGGSSWFGNLFGGSGGSNNFLGNMVSNVLPIAAMMAIGGSGKGQTQTTTQQYSYPSASYISGLRAQGTASAGKARETAYDSLARNLSVRGIGSGSPYAAGKASKIEGSYLDSLAGLNSSLLTLANTGTPSGSTTTTKGSSTNPLALALGMMMYGRGR